MRVTKKSLLAGLTAGQAKATMIGGMALDEWAKTVESVKATYPDARETEHAIYFGAVSGSERFILKPAIERVRIGRLNAGSARYTFSWSDKESSGDVKDLQVSDDGKALVLNMFNNAQIVYSTVEV